MDDFWQSGAPQDESPRDPLTNVDAEAALLGGLMIYNEFIQPCSEIVRPKDFSEPLHGRIFTCLIKMAAAGKTATPVTLKPIFDADPRMDELGGASYLAQLTGQQAVVVGLPGFASQIRDLARMRELRGAWDKAVDTYLDGSMSIAEATAPLENAIWSAVTTERPVDQTSTADMIDLAIERANMVAESKHAIGARCALIPDLDVLLGPLEPKLYTVLAARPSMGKTTCAVSAALGYALNGHPVFYPHAEMSKEIMALKVAADLAHAMGHRVPFEHIRKGELTTHDRAALAKAKQAAERLPLRFAAVGRCDVSRLDSMVAREVAYWEARERKLEVVVVDYLQLLSADGRHRTGDERGRVSAVSEALLTIAQKYDVHVMALSQLTRAVDARPDKRPHLSDLRESGRIEEDADTVAFLYRHEYYLEREKPTAPKELEEWEIDMGKARGRVEFILAKNRLGKVASRKGHFYGDYSAIRGSTHRDNNWEEPGFDERWQAFLRGELDRLGEPGTDMFGGQG